MIEYGAPMGSSYSILIFIITIAVILVFIICINYQTAKIKKEMDIMDEELMNNDDIEELDYDKNQDKEC